MGKDSGGGGANDYFGSIAGLVCAGPVSALVAVVQDKKTIWPVAERDWSPMNVVYQLGDFVNWAGRVWRCVIAHTSGLYWPPGTIPHWELYVLRRTDPGVGNPALVTVVGYGTLILYWGTEDQVLDVASEPTFAAQHPPYRRQCFVILKDWLFGRERVSAPNIEIVVAREPAQSVITGAPAHLDADLQANPLAFAAEMFTDPVFGLGQAGSLLDAPSWQAAADALTADAATTHLSPVVGRGQSFRALVADLVEYFDGWFRYNADGRIEAGRWARNTAPPGFTPETTIDHHDLIEEVSFESDGWPDTYGSAVVKFTDRERSFKQNAARAVSGLNRAVTGYDRDNILDRPWIARSGQAAVFASEVARLYAEPGLSGTISVRREKCSAIKPGSLFLLTHAALGLSVVCRCEGRTVDAPPSTRVDLRFRSEMGLAPASVQAPPRPAFPAAVPSPGPVELFEFVVVPESLAGQRNRMAVLAARTDGSQLSIRVHLRQADGVLFYELGRQSRWAVHGTLQQDYPDTIDVEDDSEALRVTLHPSTPEADKLLLQETQSADAINDDNLLVFVFRAADPAIYEVMTVKAVRVGDGETFLRFRVRRSRFGTARQSFVTGDRVWVIRRSALTTYEHTRFAELYDAQAEAVFRLQASNIWRESDLDDQTETPDLLWQFGTATLTADSTQVTADSDSVTADRITHPAP